MTTHLTENIIEQYLLSPESLTPEEKNYLEMHRKECALCAEHLDKQTAFLSGVDQNYQSQPTEKEKEFFERLTAKRRLFLPGRTRELKEKTDSLIEGFAEVIEPYKRPLPQRIFRYIRHNPVRTTVATFGLAAVLAGLLFMIKPVKDTNIAYARAKEEFLIAYNKDGGELWRKHIGPGYDIETIQKNPSAPQKDQYLATCDVDGDGKNEVLAIFGMAGDLPRENSIVCYNPDGRERWIYEFHRTMVFGKDSVPDDYVFRRLLTMKLGRNSSVEVYAVAVHQSDYESDVVRLNASDGHFISDYWHSGVISQLTVSKNVSDGNEEIILGGENNGYNLASVIVLEPANISGHGPAPASYTPANVPPGNEKYYLLLPRNDVQLLATNKRNAVTDIFCRSNSMEVRVSEWIGRESNTVLFNFDPRMRCISVEGSDQFVVFHQKMEKEGKLSQALYPTYYDHLQKGVQYWDGVKFVSTPTMNKNYRQVPPLP
ncbi:MAG: hypothetical protein ACHQQQ_09780 [Bacteroidota bacterium]